MSQSAVMPANLDHLRLVDAESLVMKRISRGAADGEDPHSNKSGEGSGTVL
jgi:hypothetical protein